MALEMRDRCERCERPLLIEASSARICSYECTFCVSCSDAMQDTCPNCGGELVARPRRTPSATVELTNSQPGR
ncbi:DUF1272 domain-containing protein [Streptomyces sp. NBC_01281]|uniref:DUF1272 domain-containing protein n=1 Tax=unclassified Streptomyces TaxID=2593676 RepID=UPI002E109325|nr:MULTISPECIES: DUF1272 domain-containing protein [unclassified Streptomyces]WSK59386.1 DUF1272 domain-containing protein [Streptomyces sp. NBC_01281]